MLVWNYWIGLSRDRGERGKCLPQAPQRLGAPPSLKK